MTSTEGTRKTQKGLRTLPCVAEDVPDDAGRLEPRDPLCAHLAAFEGLPLRVIPIPQVEACAREEIHTEEVSSPYGHMAVT